MAGSFSPATSEVGEFPPVERDDLLTLCAVGVLASMAAALGHELVGHAGACVLSGGEVTLISVIWFRCSPASAIVSLAGPFGGLAGALVGLALTMFAPHKAVRARLFGLILAAVALFWFFGQLLSDAILRGDDWGGAAAAASWPDVWWTAALLVGVAGYGVSVRLTWSFARRLGKGANAPRRFLIPFVVGAVAIVACASLRPHDGSALEAARAVVLAPLGYVWAVTRASVSQTDSARIARSWVWVGASVISLAVYAALFGPGMGRLA